MVKPNNFEGVVLEICKTKEYPVCRVEDYDDSIIYREIKIAYDNVLDGLGLDKKNTGLPAKWGPFGDFIKEGDTVLVKPNYVRHLHMSGGNIDSVMTHTVILKITLDYVFVALKGTGRVIVGDASIQTADFNKIIEICRLQELEEYYKKRGYLFEIKDFRKHVAIKDIKGNIYERRSINIDDDFIEVNLRDKSFFGTEKERLSKLRVTDFDNSLMLDYHNLFDNKYLIHKDALNADVIINLPKVKTHRKAGFTCAMKNLIGTNGHKGYLPHHTCGAKEDGGDEYLRSNRLRALSTAILEMSYRVSYWKCNYKIVTGIENSLRLSRKIIRTLAWIVGPEDSFSEGSWYGNDTLWRTIADINRICYFCDKNGQMTGNQQRVVFTLVDGIIAGDREGPMAPRERRLGLLSGGFSTYLVDYAMTAIMGFDSNKIPFMSKIREYEDSIALRERISHDIDDLILIINGEKASYDRLVSEHNMHFEPSSGWRGHIEL